MQKPHLCLIFDNVESENDFSSQVNPTLNGVTEEQMG
jgi:hypothetical protein